MALGLVLAWGVLNILNVAHGAIIMLGAYVGYYLFTKAGIDPFAGLPLTMIIMFCFGYLIQRYLLNYMIGAAAFNTLLLTFGLETVITNLAQLAFSADFRIINPSYAGNSVALLGVTVPLVRILSCTVAIALTTLLWVFLSYTRYGRAIRATAQNLIAARLYGINPIHIYAITFGIAAALAGASGVLYGVVWQVNPYIGVHLTAKSFAIAIIGGLDNTLNVIIGGIFLGIVESVSALYLGPTYSDLISFGILVLVLVVRPNGLLGKTT
jgi:branched-chain amino acid transport system permease protein